MVLKKHYKPNVAYELLIDGQYHYYGSHCRKKALLYESEIRRLSGNRLARLCNTGQMPKSEYNSRVQTLRIWEFDSAEEALKMEARLIDYGRRTYGDKCFNVMIGNNKSYVAPEEHRVKMKQKLKQSWERRSELNPKLREFFVECGKKGIINNPVLEKSKPVAQYKDGKQIAVFPSLMEASRQTGIDVANIRKVCNHKKPQTCGFQWEFVNR